METTVDLESLDNHEFIIKPEFSDDLKIIRDKLDKLKDSLDAEHRRAGTTLRQEIDKKLFMEHHKVHGWCFRLTRAEAGSIRNHKDYKEVATMKNGVYFTTSTLQDLNREFDRSTQTYNKTQSGLVDEVVAVACKFLRYDHDSPQGRLLTFFQPPTVPSWRK